MKIRKWMKILLLAVFFWGSRSSTANAYVGEYAGIVELKDEAVPLAAGTEVEKNEKAVVDYSNTGDGYVMVNYTAKTDRRLKVQVAGPSTTYTYDIKAGSWVTFPLSDGDGGYKVTVYENVDGSKYATVLAASF